MRQGKYSKLGFLVSTAVLALAGSLGCVSEHHHARGYAESPPAYGYATPPPVYVDSGVVQDDYVYYPRYEVYYSSYRRQYLYRDGGSWVYRPAPRRVSVNELYASPSVRLAFHDNPANHHASVVRQYPKHWTPTDQRRQHNQGYNERDSRRTERRIPARIICATHDAR